MDSSPKRYSNLHAAALIEIALKNNEGYLADNGAFCTETGKRTTRSLNDSFIVHESSTSDLINWGETNRPFSAEIFEVLWTHAEDSTLQQDHFVNHLEVGNHPDFYIPIEVTTQTAWHSLFAQNICVRPEHFNIKGKQKWRILHAPHFTCNPEKDGTRSEAAVIIHFAKRKVLIAGMHYAGELKKALFIVQNFLLLEKDVLPLHCSASAGEDGDISLIFGLSETGKTTLSNDTERYLMGDDEHGWGKGTVFNLEGGCYAKTINLSQQHEPLIWDSIRFGATIENVSHNSYTRKPDFQDTTISSNGRCCYPLTHITRRIEPAQACEPNSIIFLCCDFLGILPIVSKLSPEAAVYHFISGYSAQINTTETDNSEAYKPIFSACFSSLFMPNPPAKYAKLMLKRLEECNCDVYLVNTGWMGGHGGAGGEGVRVPLQITQNIIRAIQKGMIDNTRYEKLNVLNLDIPLSLCIPTKEFDGSMLNPMNAWTNIEDYHQQALLLAKHFADNIALHDVGENIILAGPQIP